MISNYVYDRGGKVLSIDHWELPNKVSGSETGKRYI